MNKTFIFDLSLFDGEGSGDGGQATGESTTPSAAGKGKGEFANVKYGKQDEPAQPDMSAADSGAQVTSDTLEAKRKAYELTKDGTVVQRKYVDYTAVTDERICDGYYFASALKIMKGIFRNPWQLDSPPETVVKDIK